MLNHFLFPVALIQEFRCISNQSMHDYLNDIDSFPHELLKDRIDWLKENNIKHRLGYTYYQQTEEPFGITYVLKIQFFKTSDSKRYREEWDV